MATAASNSTDCSSSRGDAGQPDRGHGVRPAGSLAGVAASQHAAALAGEHERGPSREADSGCCHRR
jgi:hypothetical protein